MRQRSGLPVVTLRPPFIYGPENPFYREAFFWDRMRKGRPIILPGDDLDAGVAQWLADAPAGTSPKALLPVPIFGYPGWSEGQDAAFYEDKRYFRP
jgi:hypothetical protein